MPGPGRSAPAARSSSRTGSPPTGEELIDYRLVRTESQGTWKAFLMNLAARDLLGQHLVLITTDGHRGLHGALDLRLPDRPRQA